MTASNLAIDPTLVSRRPGVRARVAAHDLLDHWLFFPSIMIACALGLSLRIIGPFFIVVPLLSCLAYASLRLTVPPRLLSIFIAFCIFIAALSLLRVMPRSWQLYFIPEAVLRQLVPIVGFWAVAWASKSYFWRQISSGEPFFGTTVVLFLTMVIAPLVMLQQGLRYQGDGPLRAMVALYGAFINNVIIANFFLLSRIFLTKDWRRYAALLVFMLIVATTPFLQFRIFALVVFAVLMGVPARWVAMGIMSVFVVTYAIGLNYVPEMMRASPDSGIRLAFIRDALKSVMDTHGIGIGYGTESVRWAYHFPGLPTFQFLPNAQHMSYGRMLEALSTGVHNSFVQALLRSGVCGFSLLVLAFLAAFPSRRLPRNTKRHAAVSFVIMFMACFVNPALESPAQAVGIGLIYGYLLAINGRARLGLNTGSEDIESPARFIHRRHDD